MFYNIGGYFASMGDTISRYGQKHLLAGFEVGFTAIVILFLEHLRLFCVVSRYGCQDTGEKIYSRVLKLRLLHSPFYFYNIEDILRWLEVRLKRYGRKHLFAGFEIRFTAFTVLFLEHWRLFCVNWMYDCQETGENVYLLALKLGFSAFDVLFGRTLDVNLHRLEVRLPRYGQKRLFTGFEMVFTAFTVLLIEHWRFFCNDWRYCWKDMGENIYSPALKLGLLHSQFYF